MPTTDNIAIHMDRGSMMQKARRLFKDMDDLPTIPAVVSKVVALLDDVAADPEKIADLILSDQVLAARVIRVVNSPFYRTNEKIVSIKRALMHLGFKNVRELILVSYFIDSFSQKQQAFDMKQFWVHSFTVGALSRRIADQIGYPDSDRANLVGIIHDIGKVFLGHYCRSVYEHMLAKLGRVGYNTYEAEYEFFGTTHCELGLCLAQHWNFPHLYCEVISCHHTPALSTEDPLLTSIVSLSDFLSFSRLAQSEGASAILPGPPEKLAWRLIGERAVKPITPVLQQFLAKLSEVFDEVDQEVDLLFNSMTST